MTLCDLNERTCCSISMLAFASKTTGRKSLVIADFLRASKSCLESANNFFATSNVIHERAATASMFLFGLSSSKFSLLQLDLTTCHGYAAGSVSWMMIAAAAPFCAAISYLYVQRP